MLKIAQQTRIEWHGDKGRIHVLFKSKMPLGDGKTHTIWNIGTAHIEVRVSRQLLFSWPSKHPTAEYFRPIGTERIYELKPGELSRTWDKVRMLCQEHFSDVDRRNYYKELEQTVMSSGDGRHFGLVDLGCWYYWRYDKEWLFYSDNERKSALEKWNVKQDPPKPQKELDDVWDWIEKHHKKARDEKHRSIKDNIVCRGYCFWH